MTPRRALPLLPLVLALAASPALAGADADPSAAAELPAACAGKAPVLREGQTLETRTAWFHGTNRVGEPDGNGVLQTFMKMDGRRPTTDETKVKTSKPGVLGNDGTSKNNVNGVWQLDVTEPTQIVCAATTVHAVAPGDAIGAQLRVDIPRSDTTAPNSVVQTQAPAGNGPRAYSGTFGRIGTEGALARTDVTVQFAPPAPGAALLYDSTSALSSFTYVVAVPAFVPEETIDE